MPGLHAMDAAGAAIGTLAGTADPAPYSALVTSFRPAAGLVPRLADMGADLFFGGPHDLVVPTDGGWVLSSRDGGAIPRERLGFFGPGGRLDPRASVHHCNLFDRPEAAAFLVKALRGESPEGAGVEARRGGRGGRPAETPGAEATVPTVPAVPAAPAPASRPAARARRSPAGRPLGAAAREPLELTLLPAEGGSSSVPLLLARFGSARVVARFERKGAHWRDIIRAHEEIRAAFEGRPGARAPRGRALEGLGALLFATLFPGEVRRLYDMARAAPGSARLDLVFTSLIDWVADKPWELAFDPLRRSFLALEEVNVVRNVVTSVPAEALAARRRPLSVLLAVSQPASAARLAWEEEAAALQAAFAPLVDSGSARLAVTQTPAPEKLHQLLSSGRYDVLHFVGHGEYDEERRSGALLFEGDGGRPRRVDAPRLRQLLCGRGLRLVCLNACESGRGGRTDFNRGVAPALVAGGLPAVVANQYSVLDGSAVVFARELYRSLALGHALGDAAREARLAVATAAGPDDLDWAVPVVFARDPAGRL